MNSIPTDLFFDIFSRLPSNSIARCRCVSKLWWSMLHQPDFTELFLTRSSTCPRLIFTIGGFTDSETELLFYSIPQPQNLYEKFSSHVVAAKYRKKLHKKLMLCGYASGLFCFRELGLSQHTTHVICNPSTGQYRILPTLKLQILSNSFVGFDPIGKQFKILCMNDGEYDHKIMTLETGKMRWRKVISPLSHVASKYFYRQEICINGVLYYLAKNNLIVCFDVKSEEFKFITGKSADNDLWHIKLINYKGKLGGIYWKYDDDYEIDSIELHILEDVQKQEWSKYYYTLPENKIDNLICPTYVVGVTATGEIVFASRYKLRSNPFYVFYFNPQRNSLQRVQIQCFPKYHGSQIVELYPFVDYVEDLRFDIIKTMYAARSSKAHLQQDRHTIESTNKFNALCLLDDDEFTGVKT